MENDIYFKRIDGRELYLVTQTLAEKIIKKLHEDNGHIGSRKVWLVFRENYICRQDYRITKEITQKCPICQKYKIRNFKNENVTKNIISRNKLDIVAIDILSDLIMTTKRNKHVLVMIDVFSKYVKLYSCRTTKGEEIMRNIDNFIATVGTPRRILLDNATYFRNDRFKGQLRERGIETNFVSIRHPQSNPSERCIQEVTKFLRITTDGQHRRWDRKVSEVEMYLNTIPSTVTKETPEYIMKGIMPIRPWEDIKQKEYTQIMEDVQRRLRRANEKYIQRQDQNRKRRPVTFQKGEKVMVRALRVSNIPGNVCAKLMPVFEGPYVINNDNGINSYVLKHLDSDKIRGIYNINDVYKYYE